MIDGGKITFVFSIDIRTTYQEVLSLGIFDVGDIDRPTHSAIYKILKYLGISFSLLKKTNI